MARYIDADNARIDADERGFEYWYSDVDIDAVQRFLDDQPTADVVEVRRGKWQMKPLFNSHLDESDVAVMIRCSGCGMKLIAQKCGPFPNYCAHCGAKMDGGSDEQEERVHH